MPKTKFDILESTCVPLSLENVDTDQIIPARFLSATSREGFGENLFRDWRYDKGGNKNESFVLNDNKFKGEILVAGKNFGCGSSREHAVWAVADFGFRAVVSSFFADIFRNNSLNNGLLPVIVSEDFLQKIMGTIMSDPSAKLRIDLKDQEIILVPTGESERFEINSYKKECLMKGLDDIDYLLGLKEMITAYEFRNTLRQ
jgi:3-isopropylmalate/(R)-2-methylmalate dehydratase small subunit